MLNWPLLGEFLIQWLTLAFMLIGLVGLIIPIFPGLVVIWLAALIYGCRRGLQHKRMDHLHPDQRPGAGRRHRGQYLYGSESARGRRSLDFDLDQLCGGNYFQFDLYSAYWSALPRRQDYLSQS